MFLTCICTTDNSKISPNYRTVPLGENVTFKCDSDEETNWIFNNNISTFPSNARVVNFIRLKIINVNRYNQGIYECEGFQDDKFYAVGMLYVIGKKDCTTYTPHNQGLLCLFCFCLLCCAVKNNNLVPAYVQAFEGEDVDFACESISTVLWYFDHSSLPRNIITGNELNTHWLRITDIDYNNVGMYTCRGATLEYNFTSDAVVKVIRQNIS